MPPKMNGAGVRAEKWRQDNFCVLLLKHSFSIVFHQKVGGAQVDANCTAGLVLEWGSPL